MSSQEHKQIQEHPPQQILVISDSHGNSEPVRLLLDRYNGKLKTVVHLGDNARDLLQLQTKYPALNLVAVAGNCDYGHEVPKELVLTLGPKAILLMHGHTHNVKMNYQRLMYYAQEKEVNACLFGHSHFPAVFSHESVFFMNPGSVSLPRGGSKASYGLLSIDSQGDITGEVIEL